ncbi:hypothetical protein [Streptomyces sp. B1-3]|uniref:hypothetical protein n=1 Tax=Streptomyces sp. B1-3 TaxID=3141453 RepID=UPI003D2A8090
MQQRISALEKAASKPILLKFIEVTTEEKVAAAFGSGKVEGMVGNFAANVVKAEFNFFDPIKIFGIQDRYDEWLLGKMRLLRKKMGGRDRKPEKPLPQEEITKDEIKRVKNRLNTIEDALRSPRTLSSLHKAVAENRRWAEGEFKALKGEKHPPKKSPKSRRSDAIPSVRQLERQEQQLRNTIRQFVHVVKGAIPESAALAREMARIEQQLK